MHLGRKMNWLLIPFTINQENVVGFNGYELPDFPASQELSTGELSMRRTTKAIPGR